MLEKSSNILSINTTYSSYNMKVKADNYCIAATFPSTVYILSEPKRVVLSQ